MRIEGEARGASWYSENLAGESSIAGGDAVEGACHSS